MKKIVKDLISNLTDDKEKQEKLYKLYLEDYNKLYKMAKDDKVIR